jgi:transposase
LTRAQLWTTPNNYSLSGYSGATTHGGALFVFRGRRGDLPEGFVVGRTRLVPFAKRLERGRFLWPQAKDGSVVLTPAQLSMLLEGIDWRAPPRTWAPEAAG